MGNPRSRKTVAILVGFTSTRHRHEIAPRRYLSQLLSNLPAKPMRELDRWLPDLWQAANPS